MKQVLASLPRASLALALLAGPGISFAAAFDSGSTGSDGVLNLTVNTEIQLPESGVLNYTSINVPAGVTLKFKKNTANTPVYLLASGDVTIAGTIDISGEDARATGTYGDGVLGDDGIPGDGGPGGYAGGRGGREDAQQRPAIIRGGAGLGPGGGGGGVEGANGCSAQGYYKYMGVGGGHVSATSRYMSCSTYPPAAVGKSYGSVLIQPMAGGSGGGGGLGGNSFPGSGGGGGGGAILIAASGTLRVTGNINARGGDGGGISGTGVGSQGAGGSGGAIRLVGSRVEGGGTLWADGGCINSGNSRRQLCYLSGSNGSSGYGGSAGRIRIEGDAITYTGTASPAYVGDTPRAVFIAQAPTLRIVSVAGQPVPANATGIADVVLPATASESPLEVGFSTTNIPLGNQITLRAVPAYGAAVEVVSPAIQGSETAGTAQASITLPAGPTTLQATTTYTVVVASLNDAALVERLSRLAQNERVEKVEVTIALEGEALAKLVTASGKSFEMPYSSIAEVGFRG